MYDATDFPTPTLISLNDIQLEVFEAGAHNAGNPIILCHGWPEHAYSWRHQIPALVDAGYHVIVPNQRGFGRSSCPAEVTAYGIDELTGDLIALLDHYGYEDAVFVGHDWGATVVWYAAMLHPERVKKLAALSVPYQPRGDQPWLALLEQYFGSDHYFVHFNTHPGVADAVFDAQPERFLANLFRKNAPPPEPRPGNGMIHLAQQETPSGEPVLSDEELAVYVAAFQISGFTGGLNWYRNVDRNWHRLAEVDPIVRHEALMVYGTNDPVQASPVLRDFVPNVSIVELDCGHWIAQERPEETTRVLLDWLG